MEMYYMSKGIDNFIEVNAGEYLREKSSPNSYRLKMLENNDIEGLIKPICLEVDGRITLKYNTCSCYVLDRLFLKLKPDGGFLQILMNQIENLLWRIKAFLLVADDVVLRPEYMFYNWGEKSLKLIYIPGYGKNIKLQMKGFLEYMMKIFDHRDQNGVRYMYQMYDLVCEDTFSMEDFNYRLEETNGQDDENTTCIDTANTKEAVSAVSTEENITKLVPLTNGALKEMTLSKYDEMILVGRGKKETDYRIPNTQISRVHACIYLRHDGVYIEDRESTNGTFINSHRIEPLNQQKIQVGDLVSFANEEFFAV